MHTGVLCNESTAEQIAATGLVETLFGHMGAKKDDDEFVLQLTFTFSKLLSYEATAAALLQNTDILYYLVDLLQDKNKEVWLAGQRERRDGLPCHRLARSQHTACWIGLRVSPPGHPCPIQPS